MSARRIQKDKQAPTINEAVKKASILPETPQSAAAETPSTASTAWSPRSSREITASTSLETLSDISVTTPSGIPGMVSDLRKHNQANGITLKTTTLHLKMPALPKQATASSPRPILKSSLTIPSDFAFDRYSKAFEPLDLDDIEVFEVSGATCSPIEVATPITYIRPNRPSMVSVLNILKKDSSKETKKPPPPKPDLPLRNSDRSQVNRRLSIISANSGFQAGEATPIEVPDLPENALTMISNASHTDLSTLTRQPEPTLKKQKSSFGLLSKAFKFGHSRMTSRPQSISPTPSSSRPQSQHAGLAMSGQAPTSRLPPASSGRPQPPQTRHVSSKSISSRPQTAVQSTSPPQIPVGVTALPPCSTTFSAQPSPFPSGKTLPPPGHTPRKKSMSILRSRGDSIGNALMSLSGKASIGRSKGRDVAREALGSPGLPPEHPRPKTSDELSMFPKPPGPSRPQSNRVSVSYSRPLRNSSLPLQGLGVTVS